MANAVSMPRECFPKISQLIVDNRFIIRLYKKLFVILKEFNFENKI